MDLKLNLRSKGMISAHLLFCEVYLDLGFLMAFVGLI